MGEVKLIKASAGSGKTYTLTKEYLSLLLKKERGYRSILAVTFTNKATAEMKERIVKMLYQESEKSDEAKRKLAQLLHDYSSFNISTIDTFFQRTMRAFAREIGKNSSYSVELDQEMVLAEAIDSMIYNLDSEESGPLLEWLISMGLEAIESGEGWNFRGKLEKLAEELFKESYMTTVGEVGLSTIDRDSLKGMRGELYTIVSNFKKELYSMVDEGLSLIEERGVTLAHFKGKSRTPMNFLKKVKEEGPLSLPERFVEMKLSEDALIGASRGGFSVEIYKVLIELYPPIASLIERIEQLYEREWRNYRTAEALLANLHSVGVLADIERAVNHFVEEQNLVLIPETTQLLNKIIDGSDAPFIYEKIGGKIDHFMLDEFQDTSSLQWRNFLPLILESLGRGNDNLVVGDVKQSIYRWRGSDSNLLGSQIYKEIPSDRIESSTLQYNWRSSEAIVEFNNSLYPFLAKSCGELLSEEEVGLYSEVEQKLPEKKRVEEGFVSVDFLDSSNSAKRDKRLLHYEKEGALLWRGYIESIVKRGGELGEIAFLVRTNREGAEVVEQLVEWGYPIISDDSLLISTALVIKKVIAALHYLVDPYDSINRALLRELNIELELLNQLATLPLFALSQALLDKFGEERDSLFIASFLDLVLDQERRGVGDIASFLEWWERSGVKKSIVAPDSQDAIRVMTIHKSKGLGIPFVILPYFELPLDHEGNRVPTLWGVSDQSPFNSYPPLPIKYNKNLMESHFEELYLEEKKLSYMDNLNLAYVATTRAIKELYIVTPLPKERATTLSVSTLLYNHLSIKNLHLLTTPINFLQEGSGGEDNGNNALDGEKEYYHYQLGSGEVNYSPRERSLSTVELPPFKSYPLKERVKLSLRGEEFFSIESDRGKGLIMHRIMELIEVEEDLEQAVERVIGEGILPKEMGEGVVRELGEAFASIRERGWFSGEKRIYREGEILLPNGLIKRPDRVVEGEGEWEVIDFKFGANREPSHLKQMREYMEHISEAKGGALVRGWLWYPDQRVVLEV